MSMGSTVCTDLSRWMSRCKTVCFAPTTASTFACNMANLFGSCRRRAGYCPLGIECHVIICNKRSINHQLNKVSRWIGEEFDVVQSNVEWAIITQMTAFLAMTLSPSICLWVRGTSIETRSTWESKFRSPLTILVQNESAQFSCQRVFGCTAFPTASIVLPIQPRGTDLNEAPARSSALARSVHVS